MTTPPSATADKIQPNRGPDDPRGAPRREDLAGRAHEVLRRGPAHKADLVKVDAGRESLVLKDFSRKPWIWRLLGRLQLRRELRAYRHLGVIAGAPRVYGRVDADAFAMEWIDGAPLKTLPDRIENGAAYVRQLEEIAARIHGAGLVHLDLRSNNNVVVRRDGRVFVLDFASAVWLMPGSLRHRVLFRPLRALDLSGLLKWKRCLLPERLTAADRTRIARHERLSALWFVNRKRAGRKRSPGATGSRRQNPEPPAVSPSSDGA